MKLTHILAVGLIVSGITACSSDKPPVQPTYEEVITINETSYYNSIWFDHNSAVVSDKYDSIIDLNADYLLANPMSQVQIQGNTSEIGTTKHNQKLAATRAKAVTERLLAAGVNPTQIQDVSFGATRPLFPNNQKGESAKNRRVDIIYISGAPSPYFIDLLPVVTTEDETVEFDPINVKEQTQKIQHNTASGPTTASAPIINVTTPDASTTASDNVPPPAAAPTTVGDDVPPPPAASTANDTPPVTVGSITAPQ